MKAVLQRVRHANVVVEGETVGSIGVGLVVLLGAARGDVAEDVRWLARKMAEMRIFSDADGKFNLALADVGGAILLVSQFTLLADTRKGRRPSFLDAAPPEEAEALVSLCADTLRQMGLHVETGRFGAHMEVSLLNDGPVTILLD
ncbi:MAG TPA: D-aminoacyl-tRNA deacylase, partial [Chloroflexia bacterium]|nr:D-aminoacyl-tRNA deacylase [Chloroflexia bacterium]